MNKYGYQKKAKQMRQCLNNGTWCKNHPRLVNKYELAIADIKTKQLPRFEKKA